jgi:hypothetical protein
MFESWHFPNGWNGNNRFIAYLDKKDFESVKDLQKNLLESKFIQLNTIFVSIHEIEKDTILIKDSKDLKLEFRTMKFKKLFDKLYVPYIQKHDQEKRVWDKYYFVDDLSQAHYINTYPAHLHTNIIQFTKFMLGKKSSKLSSDEIKELYAVSGFQSDQ